MKKILMSTIILSLFAATLTLIQISSCTKTDASPTIIHDTVKVTIVDTVCPTPKYPITGLWIGTYTVPQVQGQFYYSFAIYPDNTILVKSKGADGNTYYSAGTWKLSSNNLFTATYTSMNYNGSQVTQTTTATYSNSGVLTNGIEVNTANPSLPSATLSTMQRIN